MLVRALEDGGEIKKTFFVVEMFEGMVEKNPKVEEDFVYFR